MKLHITVEQLNELSEKGKERLREWWKKHLEYGTFFAWKNNKRQKNWYVELWYEGSEFEMPNKWNNFYPLLSIGQLIQFLDEHIKTPYNNLFIKTNHGAWQMTDIIGTTEHYDELCDALFEAVKDILEKEDK